MLMFSILRGGLFESCPPTPWTPKATTIEAPDAAPGPIPTQLPQEKTQEHFIGLLRGGFKGRGFPNLP